MGFGLEATDWAEGNNYPNVDQVIPVKEPVFTVALNPQLLIDLLKVFTAGDCPMVKLKLYATDFMTTGACDTLPVMLESVYNFTDTRVNGDVLGLIMPVKIK